MKEKQTIAEGLLKKDIKIPSNFIWFAYSLLAKTPFYGGKYHVTYKIIDDINQEKGPAFVIWNHLSRRDFIFLKNLLGKRKFNMVSSYSEFYRGNFRSFLDVAQVIPKKNFEQDTASIRMMAKIISMGGTICFAPEGMCSDFGDNKPIVPGTGRFLKYFRAPVYFAHLEGAFLTNLKTCVDDRPGKVNITLSKLFSVEDLAKLSGEEIDQKINEVFRHDDFEWNKTARVKYKTKNKQCTNWDTMLYKCPKCGHEFEMDAHDNVIKCKHCGNGCSVNDYYDFIPFDKGCVIPESMSKWAMWERGEVIKEIRKDKKFSFSYKCKIGKLPDYKLLKSSENSIPCGEGKITLDHEGVHFEGTKDGKPDKFTLSYLTCNTLVINNDTTVYSLYVNGVFYDIIPEGPYVGKTLLIIEEMHRLHFNVRKNFPWYDHLYKGTELEKK